MWWCVDKFCLDTTLERIYQPIKLKYPIQPIIHHRVSDQLPIINWTGIMMIEWWLNGYNDEWSQQEYKKGYILKFKGQRLKVKVLHMRTTSFFGFRPI